MSLLRIMPGSEGTLCFLLQDDACCGGESLKVFVGRSPVSVLCNLFVQISIARFWK